MDDMIARLSATPSALAHLLVDIPEERLDLTLQGDWSPRTILAHLRDGEYLAWRLALERILAEEAPTLSFLHGPEWEPQRNGSRDRRELLLADFALQRQASLAILRTLRPADRERTASLADGRRFTLARLVESWASHDAEHIAGLEAALGETLAEALARRARPD